MPEPLTQRQVDATARRAAKGAVRRYIRGSLVGYAILIVGVVGMYENGQHVSATERGAVVESGRAVTVDGCNRDFVAVGRLRGILQRAEAQTDINFKKGRISESEADQAHNFYAQELAKLPLPDCRKVKFVLTSDPDKPIQQPKPLHP